MIIVPSGGPPGGWARGFDLLQNAPRLRKIASACGLPERTSYLKMLTYLSAAGLAV